MAPLHGLFTIWGYYSLLRFLLAVHDQLAILHWLLTEPFPDMLMGSLHSYCLVMIFLIWEWTHNKLFYLQEFLLTDTYANEFVWIPEIDFSPLGYQ